MKRAKTFHPGRGSSQGTYVGCEAVGRTIGVRRGRVGEGLEGTGGVNSSGGRLTVRPLSLTYSGSGTYSPQNHRVLCIPLVGVDSPEFLVLN